MTIDFNASLLTLKFHENLLFGVKLLNECKAYRYVVLAVVDHHIHYIYAIFLPFATNLFRLTRMNNRENYGC